ncbi:MAG: response regulator [Methanospirillum sp.]|uniref:ATP-binding response regulator n=1 Tax=Methanospirillum sp. TaxID=45200 RepID=UPI002371CA2D|nr:response regulator [Methanospirillum sp.]MDD1730515.1 response regulator [Methanospirillum sp.]
MPGVDLSVSYPEQYVILYVDDERDLLDTGKIFIEKTGGFKVHTHSSAIKALKSPDILRYDAIVSDYQMPGMDGINFLKEIRKRDTGIPFILFTGRGREEVVIEAINNGANFYVQKGGDPISLFAELTHKIRQAVEYNRANNLISRLDTYQKKLATAMNLVHVVHWECDALTYVFTFDDRFYAMYGTSAEREGGTQLSTQRYSEEFIHPDDRECALSEVKKGLENPDPDAVTYIEHRIIRRDGEIRNILVGMVVIRDSDGRIIRTYGANQDITERKNGERALERAYRQINLLTGVTRHDILNNLSALYLHLDLARMNSPGPEFSEYLDNMEKEIRIIQSRIEFTQIFQEIGAEKPVWIPLSSILPDSSAPLPVTYDLVIHTVSILVDPLVKTIFSTLLDNSIRHGEKVTEIRVSAHESGNNLTILWEDNGVGVADEEKELIFTRGYGKHTGFGLFLAREILALTGISIRETGIPGSGVRFEIIIPKGSFRIDP